MHFSPGKIQQRVRSAQRFSHLKCIEFITYSQPTVPRRPVPALPAAPTLIDNVFSRARDSRVSFVTARLFRQPENAAENKIAMEKFRDALTARRGDVRFVPVRFAPREILVSGTSAFHFRPADSENNSG